MCGFVAARAPGALEPHAPADRAIGDVSGPWGPLLGGLNSAVSMRNTIRLWGRGRRPHSTMGLPDTIVTICHTSRSDDRARGLAPTCALSLAAQTLCRQAERGPGTKSKPIWLFRRVANIADEAMK